MKKLIVSGPAISDLEGIAAYTEKKWGQPQKVKYLEQLQTCFASIQANPKRGTPRDDIIEGYRSVSERRHVIFYRETDAAVEIVRVLHERMDLGKKLPGEKPKEIN